MRNQSAGVIAKLLVLIVLAAVVLGILYKARVIGPKIRVGDSLKHVVEHLDLEGREIRGSWVLVDIGGGKAVRVPITREHGKEEGTLPLPGNRIAYIDLEAKRVTRIETSPATK